MIFWDQYASTYFEFKTRSFQFLKKVRDSIRTVTNFAKFKTGPSRFTVTETFRVEYIYKSN